MMKPSILLIDDDATVLASLALALKQAGYASRSATSAHEALRLLHASAASAASGADSRAEPFVAVVQDMNFSRQTSGEEGLELLEAIKKIQPTLPVILITAWGSIELAVQGMKRGAADFITKPWTNGNLVRSLENVLNTRIDEPSEALNASSARQPHGSADATSPARPVFAAPLSRETLDERYAVGAIIGRDPSLLAVLSRLGKVAATTAPVLITGENGTGKELIADALHRNSPRHAAPFVRVNMGSITPTLFESELFGHVKGAFTGATADRKGRFEAAHTGTLFLDEIGDLDLSCQVKLLRALQEGTFEPVGSSATRTVDVRVISATNRNLHEMIARGAFREDLLYRLNLVTLHLPPLRERREDIAALAAFFLASAAQAYQRPDLVFSADVPAWLQSRAFQGNIRELKHLIERAVLFAESPVLGVAEFAAVADGQNNNGAHSTYNNSAQNPDGIRLPAVGSMTLEEVEEAMIRRAVAAHPDNLTRVAELLGLTRQALYRRLEKYGINA
jgi:two-component system, NtrC family, response regulator